MKLFLLFILFTYTFVESTKPKPLEICWKKHKDNVGVDKFFENIYDEIKGIPESIPFHGMNLTIPALLKDVITGQISVGDGSLSNFLNITLCIEKPLSQLFNFTINTLKIDSQRYTILGEVSDLFDLYGDGPFTLNFEKISFAANNFKIHFFKKCAEFELGMTLHRLTGNFMNLMNNDTLLQPMLNKMIGDLGPDVIDYYWPAIYEELAPYIQKILDKYSHKIDLLDLSHFSVDKNAVRGLGKCSNFP